MSEVALITRLRFEDPTRARVETRPAGERISDLVAIAVPGASEDMLARVVVTISSPRGAAIIPRRDWRRWKTIEGRTVDIHLPPAGSGVLRTIISFAVLAVSAFASIFFLPLLGTAFATGTIGNAIGTAVISAAGGFLANRLIPSNTAEQPEQRYALSGIRNRVDPWGVVPAVRGKLRVYPPYAVMPHTKVVGDELHFVGVFMIGEGPHSLNSCRIGDTALSKFTISGFELRAGWPDDEPLTLVTECIFEDPNMGVELKQADGWVTRRTAPRTESISVDLAFLQGLSRTNDDGDVRPASVIVELRYQPAFDGSETPDEGAWIYLDPFVITEQKLYSFWVTRRWTPDGDPREFWVDMRRYTEDQSDGKTTDNVTWSALRTIRHQYPIAYPRPLALAAVAVKGSRQFNGMLDQFNLIASAVVPDWNGTSWAPGETSNPASLSRDVLMGSANALARTEGQLNQAEFAEWHGWNVEKSLTYNRYHDFKLPARQAFAEIAAAGRASPTQFAGLWSIVIDRPQTVGRGHISQRNAHGFGGVPQFRKLPDAFRVKFLNRDRNWKPDEIIVKRPGLVGEPVLFEEREYPGYDTVALNIRAGRHEFADLMLRTELFYASQKLEYLFAPRGSLVYYNYPVIEERQASGRVIEVATATVGTTVKLMVSLDAFVEMEAGEEYAVRFQKADGNTNLWTVETTPGRGTVLTLANGPATPAVGDIALFGTLGHEAQECIVRSIEGLKGLSARMTFVAHAPEIEAIADDDVPLPASPVPSLPAWSASAPAVPIISDARSGSDEVITGEVGAPLIVHVRGAGGGVPVDHFVVTAQRGAEAPIDITVPGWSGRAVFDDFEVGDEISIIATAVNSYGVESAACDPVTHIVKERTDLPADVATVAVTTYTSGNRRIAWTLDPDATPAQVERITSYRLRMRPGSGWGWADMAAGDDLTAARSPFSTSAPAIAGDWTIGIVSVDRLGQLAATPATVDVTLGASAPPVTASRIESVEGWDGTITDGAIAGGALEGTAGPPSLITYTTPEIDLGADMAVEVAATAYGVVGVAAIAVSTGLTADGAAIGTPAAPGIVTARYLALTITVTHPDALAELGDLVTIITPA